VRLSTSNSKVDGAATRVVPIRATWALVACMVLLLLVVEVICRVGIPRLSKIEARLVGEYKAALAIKSGGPKGHSVLMLGNSLLEAAVDVPALKLSLQTEQVFPHRFFVTSTGYIDWYFGIRRLLAEGARPDSIVLVTSDGQLAGSTFNAPSSAWHLVRTRDVLQLAQTVKASNTETSDLLFANLSALYGLREEWRKWLFFKVVPDLPDLMARLTVYDTRLRVRSDLAEHLAKRLTDLSREAGAYGISFSVVIVPTLADNPMEVRQILARASELSSVPVIVPIPHDELGPEFYSDGFHLNQTGMRRFTPRLRDALASAAAQARKP
jgi:hypothetical protein